jgi:nitrate reductase gamma subunit
MTLVVYAAIYGGVVVFITASVLRAVRLARLPLHLRWELYPVPHEQAHRARHGGSYFEESEWWRQPRHPNILGDLRAMLPEMFLLRGLWRANPRLWFRSFPFHSGLYLLFGAIVLVAAAAITAILAPATGPRVLVSAMGRLAAVAGVTGWILTTLGALLLLHRRLTDHVLRAYTVPADILNLVSFVVVLGTLAAGLFIDPGPGVHAVAIGVFTCDRSVPVPALLGLGLVLGALLVAYIPLTHMSHFIAKYFTYHAVRWDDRPSMRGETLEARVADCLAYRPTWAARHIGADGTTTWAGIATGSPGEEARR